MITLVQRFDRWLYQHLVVLSLLLLVVVLRVPNFFEPYWYGDEGIYLTIGNALRDGERLYTDIIDHKTPLIYYLASVPSQLHLRVLTVVWMLITTIAFYQLAKKIIPVPFGAAVAGTIFVLLTSLPWFEGNIPNGELFVMGFVLVSAWILTRTSLWAVLMEQRQSLDLPHDGTKLVIAGLGFGLAVLTKVPAILDLAALLLPFWFVAINYLSLKPAALRTWKKLLPDLVIELSVFGFSAATVILLSIAYFAVTGSGQDYLTYGLLYNFRYAASWGLPFANVFLKWLFTLAGKASIAGLVLILLSMRKQWFSRNFQLVAGWFVLALFAALLSNRPYPHYFQQLVPPLALLVGITIINLENIKTSVQELLTTLGLIGWFGSCLLLLKFSPYQTIEYYSRFVKLLTHQWSVAEYRQSFNHLMTDNYQAAEIIKRTGADEIFIWGTNAMLYALSDTQPVGRFTVAFHIKDFQAYQETMAAVRQKQPAVIVVMKDESDPLPGLDEYLTEHYVMNNSFAYFTLWKRADGLIKEL